MSNDPFFFENLWDVNDVARFLKVSRSWVYHQAEAGLLPYLRVGGLLRFNPKAILQFVADQEAGRLPASRVPRRVAVRAKRRGDS